MTDQVNDADAEPGGTSDLLWHYTSLDAFLSIAETKQLRATSLYYLNDASEGALGPTILRRRALEASAKATGADKEFLEELVRWLDLWPVAIGVYVLCFSVTRDDLSQWRGYTPHGRGLALGIDVLELNKRARELGPGWLLQNCIYDPICQQAIMDGLLDDLRGAAAAAAPRIQPRRRFTEVARLKLEVIAQTWAIMKDKSFDKEREVRLVSPLIMQNDRAVKFRPGRTTIVPYIEVPLIGKDGGLTPEISIIVGPGPSQRLTHDAVAQVMSRHPIARAVNFYCSPIPYREL
jgi:hypothetical protein